MTGDRPERDVHALVREQEVEDVRTALGAAKARERRHWTWAACGASPSALLVGLGLMSSGTSLELLVAFSAVVAVVEGWRGSRAGREARGLERRLEALRAGGSAGAADVAGSAEFGSFAAGTTPAGPSRSDPSSSGPSPGDPPSP